MDRDALAAGKGENKALNSLHTPVSVTWVISFLVAKGRSLRAVLSLS